MSFVEFTNYNILICICNYLTRYLLSFLFHKSNTNRHEKAKIQCYQVATGKFDGIHCSCHDH